MCNGDARCRKSWEANVVVHPRDVSGSSSDDFTKARTYYTANEKEEDERGGARRKRLTKQRMAEEEVDEESGTNRLRDTTLSCKESRTSYLDIVYFYTHLLSFIFRPYRVPWSENDFTPVTDTSVFIFNREDNPAQITAKLDRTVTNEWSTITREIDRILCFIMLFVQSTHLIAEYAFLETFTSSLIFYINRENVVYLVKRGNSGNWSNTLLHYGFYLIDTRNRWVCIFGNVDV